MSTAITDGDGAGGALREPSPAWYRALVQRSTDVAIVVDPDGTLKFVSDAVERILGWRPEDVVGTSVFDYVLDEDVEKARERLANVIAASGEQPPFEVRARKADGTWGWVENRATNQLDNPDVEGVVVNFREIDERKSVETALRRSEERYRAIVETAQEGIWVVDDTGRTVFANQKMADLLGRSLNELYQIYAAEVVVEDERAAFVNRMRNRERLGQQTYETSFVRSGEHRIASVSASPLRADDGTYVGSLAMVTDITERKQAEAQLERRALFDELTGLPNRALLADRLKTALAQRGADGLALLFLDLDGFKLVNDSYGHETGDRLLRAVASRLRAVMRTGDTLARLAGDEFVAVCPGLDDSGARTLANRALEALSTPFDLGDAQVQVNASIGIAHAVEGHGLDDLLGAADTAMLEAKRQGRGGHVTFDPNTTAPPRDRLQRIQELKRAIVDNQLLLHYQPLVDLETGRIVAAEALARWAHPELGLLAPADFIPLAERSGLIVPLGRALLHLACTQAAKWQVEGGAAPAVAVNISARQLAHDILLRDVRSALDSAGLPPSRLRLEITETATMDDLPRALRTLRDLREMGIELAVDDFGTGYSSLASLTRLPLDELKVDQAFISEVVSAGEGREVVKAIVAMARALGLRVVAEGVETEEAAAAVTALGCSLGQGFLYSRPVEADEIPRLIATRR